MVLGLWLVCNHYWFAYQSVYLHSLLTVLVVVRVIGDGFFLAAIAFCPWDSFSPEYLQTVSDSADIIYESLWFTVILLLSYVLSSCTA